LGRNACAAGRVVTNTLAFVRFGAIREVASLKR
jgi:hypothetical protein